MAADLLARVRAEIDARLADLRGAVAEHERLLGAADALDAGAARAGARSSGEEAPTAPARAKPRARAKPAARAKPRARAEPPARAKPPARGAARSRVRRRAPGARPSRR